MFVDHKYKNKYSKLLYTTTFYFNPLFFNGRHILKKNRSEKNGVLIEQLEFLFRNEETVYMFRKKSNTARLNHTDIRNAAISYVNEIRNADKLN